LEDAVGYRPQEPQVPIDPDVGIPDLIRRLTDDSKRLASDEFRLAKLELHENVRTGARGTLRLALAFGAGVVAMAALTIGLTALIGRLANSNYWLGALIVGAAELAVAYVLVKRGLKQLSEPSYTLAQTRESLKDTTAFVAVKRAD
jgi:uncharacterized membrane protein YqjE